MSFLLKLHDALHFDHFGTSPHYVVSFCFPFALEQQKEAEYSRIEVSKESVFRCFWMVMWVMWVWSLWFEDGLSTAEGRKTSQLHVDQMRQVTQFSLKNHAFGYPKNVFEDEDLSFFIAFSWYHGFYHWFFHG